MGERWLARVAWVVGLALVAHTLHQAWAATWTPAGIPTYDVADYLLRAHQIADAARAGDAAGLVDRLLTPDVHPPLHPAVIAAVFATVSPSTAAACVVAFVEGVLGLALLVVVGWRVDPRVGAGAGLLAALLTSASVLHRGLATAPMTEPLSLVAVLAALALALGPDPASPWRRSLGVGAAVLAAGLVRYNLVPMLLVPLALDHGARVLAGARSVRDPRWIGWAAPSAVGFGLWLLARPALAEDVRYFFTNNDSGVPTWSAENLAWLPVTLADEVAGAWPVVGVVGAAALVGLGTVLRRLRAGEPGGDLLVHAYVLVALGALFAHPFKLERNLHAVAPLLYLAAALPIARLARVLAARHVGLGAVGLAGAIAAFVALRGATDARVDAERWFSQDAEVRAALDLLVTHAKPAERIVVAGAHRSLNEHLVTLTLRAVAPDTAVVLQPLYPPDCDADPPPPNAVCTPTEVDRWLGTPGTVYATIAQAGAPAKKATRGRREGTARLARDVAERIAGVPGLGTAELDLHRARLRLTVYAPGAESAAPEEAVVGAPLPLKGRRRRAALAEGAGP